MTDWKKLHGDFFKNQRILVTGGAGFIGGHIVEGLVALGANVVVLDDLSGGKWDNLSGFDQNITKITGSILDESALTKAVTGCKYIFHEAALASVPQSVAEPVRFYQVNVTGTLMLMEAARQAKVQRVIYAGSSSAYGDGEESPKHENMAATPVSPYASSKLAGEEILCAWSKSYGIDTAIVRYFNIFGTRQNANSAYAAVIAAFANSPQGDRVLTLAGHDLKTGEKLATVGVDTTFVTGWLASTVNASRGTVMLGPKVKPPVASSAEL